jgi:hypothetical protein
MNRIQLKEEVIKLRKKGKTYSEIQRILKRVIPKSTISYWCRSLPLPAGYQNKIEEYNKFNLNKARKVALIIKKQKRKDYLESIIRRNKHLIAVLRNPDVAKIVLAMLYFCEGSKTQKGSLMFGNSDPLIINLFLKLLRRCYKIDEQKFRCTLQGRADQDIKKLEKYWSRVTQIPLSQFYEPRIDPRTIGQVSKNPDYKGVCRIDYFSADIYNELKIIAQLISKNY